MEYALLIASIALIAAFAVQRIGDNANTSFGNASTAIETTLPPTTVAPGGAGGAGGGGGGAIGGAGGAGGGTPTTVAPTTVAPVTVAPTTAAPTTTAAPPTTAPVTTPPATKAPKNGGGTWGDTATTSDGKTWTTSATFTIRDNNDKPIAGANVSMKVRYQERDQNNQWQWKEDVVQARSDANGTINVTRSFVAKPGVGNVSNVTYNVEGAQLPNNLEWDQQRPSVAFKLP